MVFIKESTRLFYQRRWDTFLKWLSDRPVSSGTIEEYVNLMRINNHSASNINAFIVTASHYVPDYVELPKKLKKDYEGRRKPPLTKDELTHFMKGIPTLTPDQQEDIYRLLQGEPTERYYASIYFLVQKLGLLTLGRAISPSQIRGGWVAAKS